MNGNNNNKKPGMGNQNPMDRKGDTGRGDMGKGGDNRPKGGDYNKGGEYKKPSNPGNPSSTYKPDIRSNDKMKGDKCPDCGQYRSKCTCE